MRPIEIIGNVICVAGAALWAYGYFTAGHPTVVNWPSFAFPWISVFLPNLESEIGMVASFAGMILVWVHQLAR
jgi:hypothetical protein